MELYDLDRGKTFLVSQKALIVEDGRVLLLKSPYLDRWELPGGLLELDEDLDDGLRREVYEETSLNVAVIGPISTCAGWFPSFVFRDNRVVDARIVFINTLCTKLGGTIQLSDEHSDYTWAGRSDLTGLVLSSDCKSALDAFFAVSMA